MLTANSAAILTDAFPAERRGFALGFNQVAALAGQFIGLVAGGLLAVWDWRAVFWVNVPSVSSARSGPTASCGTTGFVIAGRIDWWGNTTFAIGLERDSGRHHDGSATPWRAHHRMAQPVVIGMLIGGSSLWRCSS